MTFHSMHGNLGPYKVTRVLPHKAVEVEALTSSRTMIVAQSRVMILKEDLDPDLARSLEATDGEVFVVESIIGHRAIPEKGFHVKWAGYDTPTWEPISNFSSQNVTAREYIKEHKLRWRLRRIEAPPGRG